MLVLIKGAGDLATGTACRLHRAGFQIVMTDLEQPTAVRRTVAFSQCIYDGVTQVEGITARRAETSDQAADLIRKGEIPVLADPQAKVRRKLSIDAVVDAILAKKNLGTRITDAPIVLALGPGFTAGVDCHGVIETQRGHHLGRLLLEGSAAPDTDIPHSGSSAPAPAGCSSPPWKSALRSRRATWWPGWDILRFTPKCPAWSGGCSRRAVWSPRA